MNTKSSSDLPLDRTIDAWLDLGPTELSDRVVERARAEVHRTRQRRGGPIALRLVYAPRVRLLGYVAMAAAVVALIGAGLKIASSPPVGASPSIPVEATPRAIQSFGTTAYVGSFQSTGSLVIRDRYGRFGRVGHTATLLKDGRVLIVGGSNEVGDAASKGLSGSTLLASAELYDPATGTFSPTGSMATARAHHTATLLGDGRVLIAGGGNSGMEGGGFTLASAEIYDPATGTFSATDSMREARQDASAILLSNGRVLVIGGLDVSHGAAAVVSAELYDPVTSRFAETGTPHTHLTFVANTGLRLLDGRVLVVEGPSSSAPAQYVEIYDPATGYFTPSGTVTLGPNPATSAVEAVSTLADGRVLLTGGSIGDAPPIAVLYDPATEGFTLTGPPLIAPWGSATLLTDGRVLLAGGQDPVAQTQTDAAEVYDPVTGLFSAVGRLGTARTGQSATLLLDGHVLIVGGGSNTNATFAYASAELFH